MSAMLIISIVIGIMAVIGIIRIMIKPADGFWDLFAQLFILDVLFDILIAVIEGIGEGLS